jgi:hypothetical protein
MIASIFFIGLRHPRAPTPVLPVEAARMD